MSCLFVLVAVAALGSAALAAAQPAAATPVLPTDFIAQSLKGNTTISMNLQGAMSTAASPIKKMSWVVRSRTINGTDPNPITTGSGKVVQFAVPSGAYDMTLTAYNSDGQSATVIKPITIGGGRATDVMSVIASPASWVQLAAANATADTNKTAVAVVFDATGSRASPGAQIKQYSWSVFSLPKKAQAGKAFGPYAVLPLSPGKYMVTLKASDTTGKSAEAQKNFTVAAARAAAGSKAHRRFL